MTNDWKSLRSGTDIRGVAQGTPERPATLTEARGALIGRAFARWLAERAGKPASALRIAVGRDSRTSGEALATALAQGIREGGATVLACRLSTTPAMFMSTVLRGTDGAVMVTASHLPGFYNGFKFFSAEGGLEGQDVSALLGIAAGKPDAGPMGALEPADGFLSEYSAHLKAMVQRALGGERPLSGLRIAVDAGNGAGGFYAALLDALGADTAGSQFLTPDGTFPGHAPNPEAAEAMDSIARAVREAGADLGVIFDADCDRAALVGIGGRPINRNRLIALTAAMLLRETPGATIVTDSVVSAGLSAFIAQSGGRLHRYLRGYRNVIGEAKRLNGEGIDCPLAMETSGHAALRENYFLDDGMYLVTRLIIEAMRAKRAGGGLETLLDGLSEPAESVEARLPIRAAAFREIGEAAIARVRALDGFTVDPDNREGVRMLRGAPGEWFLLRLSLHEPLLVLNAESDSAGGTAPMLAAVREALAEFTVIETGRL